MARTPTPWNRLVALGLAFGVFAAGCSSGPAPKTEQPPPNAVPKANAGTGFTRIVSGAEDSVSAIPGSPDAQYYYRFRQIEPASERFTLLDRDLSFYFKPSPDALHFQVENRQARPVWIEWDRSTFFAPHAGAGKLAHSSTRWRDRNGVQAPTQIVGLQRYGDYLLPVDYLLDPAGGDEQLHRPLLPEDASALQFTDAEFGVDLVFRIEDRFRTYSFRYRVASVIPR
jgi:hypothetical protein